MSDVRKKLEGLLEDLASTLAEAVKDKDCPSATLNVARQLLKDNGIEARAIKGSPLGALADNLPSFTDDDLVGDEARLPN